jgi:hypothetical protein
MRQNKILENSGWKIEMQKLPQDVCGKKQSVRIESKNIKKDSVRIHSGAFNRYNSCQSQNFQIQTIENFDSAKNGDDQRCAGGV